MLQKATRSIIIGESNPAVKVMASLLHGYWLAM